jgi:hypothetical protein
MIALDAKWRLVTRLLGLPRETVFSYFCPGAHVVGSTPDVDQLGLVCGQVRPQLDQPLANLFGHRRPAGI